MTDKPDFDIISDTDILDTGLPVVVPVNCMGRIESDSLMARVCERHPRIAQTYREACLHHEYEIGIPRATFLRDGSVFIFMPLVYDWRSAYDVTTLVRSLIAIDDACVRRGIERIAVPRIGNGCYTNTDIDMVLTTVFASMKTAVDYVVEPDGAAVTALETERA